MVLKDQRDLYEIPSSITYLNCASMAPQLKSVTRVGEKAVQSKGEPWKVKPGDWFEQPEQLRTIFAEVIGASKENIALIPAVSYGIAAAARNVAIQKGQEILTLEQQFPSNVYAWREVAREKGATVVAVQRQPGERWTERILERVSTNTCVVSIPLCHWADGSIVDLKAISRKIKSVGGALVVDASQSLGAYPFDIKEIDPDFLVTVGYKWLMGPYGLGFMYVADKYCTTGKPLEYSWLSKKGSEDFTSLVDYQDEYRPGARRFDMGEFSSFIHVPMAIEALKQILSWGVGNIQETISVLTNKIEKHAREKGLHAEQSDNRVGHMLGVSVSDKQIAQLQKLFADQQIFVSWRGNNLRVAPYLYNTDKDIEKLLDCLNKL